MALQQGQEVAAVDAVVAKDGSGDFTTITSAVDASTTCSIKHELAAINEPLESLIIAPVLPVPRSEL